jgi:hypothetical protein
LATNPNCQHADHQRGKIQVQSLGAAQLEHGRQREQAFFVKFSA